MRGAAANRPVAEEAPRRITILGATGSIGASTLAVIAARRGAYAVDAVTANANATRVGRQIDALTRTRRTWQTHRREKISAGDFREGRQPNADV